MARSRSFGIALVLALTACGAPPSPASSGGAVHLPAAGAPPPEADAPASTRRGVAIVALERGEAVVRASKSLARIVYKRPLLRPHADEGSVRVLAGEAAPEGNAALAELAELRAALPADLESASARALLEGLAKKVDTRAMVLVRVSETDGRATARLLRVDEIDGALALHVDPAIFTAAAPLAPPDVPAPPEGPAPPASSADYAWVGVDDALVAILGASEIGPRRDATAPAPPKPPDDGGIASKPWFWVIIGGVAALGVTAVIVSQTVDTSSGTVHIQGKVLP